MWKVTVEAARTLPGITRAAQTTEDDAKLGIDAGEVFPDRILLRLCEKRQ